MQIICRQSKWQNFLKFAHASYLPMSTKECLGFMSYYKNVKRPGFYALVFHIFNNSRSKQNKKIPDALL